MGQSCSTACGQVRLDSLELSRADSPDPIMYDLMRKSIQATMPTTSVGPSQQTTQYTSPQYYKPGRRKPPGQHHLLYKHFKTDSPSSSSEATNTVTTVIENTVSKDTSGTASATAGNHADSASWLPIDAPVPCPTRLLIRRRSLRVLEERGETHIYAIRYPEDSPDKVITEQVAPRLESARQEQCPTPKVSSAITDAFHQKGVHTASKVTLPNTLKVTTFTRTTTGTNSSPKKKGAAAATTTMPMPMLAGNNIFSAAAMASTPRQSVMDWVTVSDEHHIYIADVGLTATQCDHIVNVTEKVCRGQYAAYTYAKQTLGCREYPILAQTGFHPVHTVTEDIIQRLGKENHHLQLDDREPHIVKYDVTKKERQKLDMHTDKSEWTFLIALSNGCGVDYEGGGTYFECLDATVHIQRGHALIFPGKLRHCGQKITSGLRFLLVGFLVDKPSSNNKSTNKGASSSTTNPSGTRTTSKSSASSVVSPPGIPPVRS